MSRRELFFLIFSVLMLSSVVSQNFTLAIIPDTQNYSWVKCQKNYGYPINQADIWYRQMEYIANNSRNCGGFIDFAIHLGDLVQTSNEIKEWNIANRAMSILDNKVPYIVIPGNHDYEISDGIFDDSNFLKYKSFTDNFGPSSVHFQDQVMCRGFYSNGANSWATMQYEDKRFLIIGLETEPVDDVLEWAQGIINSHPGYAVVVAIHEYLSLIYEADNPGTPLRINKARINLEVKTNSPEEIWEKFIKKNNRVFLVLCGHIFWGDDGESIRTDLNNDGYKVYQILSDFQGRNEIFDVKKCRGIPRDCGDGWFRLMEFDFEKRRIYVRTYSSEFDCYEDDTNSQFTITYNWNWNDRFGLIEN